MQCMQAETCQCCDMWTLPLIVVLKAKIDEALTTRDGTQAFTGKQEEGSSCVDTEKSKAYKDTANKTLGRGRNMRRSSCDDCTSWSDFHHFLTFCYCMLRSE
jgi:hypothetical protein